jgi:hypothetical protein
VDCANVTAANARITTSAPRLLEMFLIVKTS